MRRKRHSIHLSLGKLSRAWDCAHGIQMRFKKKKICEQHSSVPSQVISSDIMKATVNEIKDCEHETNEKNHA